MIRLPWSTPESSERGRASKGGAGGDVATPFRKGLQGPALTRFLYGRSREFSRFPGVWLSPLGW